MKVLLTGAGGFIGRPLVDLLLARGVDVEAAVRNQVEMPCPTVTVGEIDSDTDWGKALAGVDLVIHLAARVHVMREREKDPLAAFRRVNLDGTANLARQAAAAGVRRFIYLSTVKVIGEESGDTPFSDASPCRPLDPYAVSKLEAEEALFAIGAESGMAVVVLRPPLVYGPGVKGNFARLLRLARLGVPLPFARVDNRRSLIFIENLLDAIYHCLSAVGIAGRAYLVSDGEALSTAELLRRLMRNMGKRTVLLPVPPMLLKAAAAVFGLGREMERLTGSLEVDDSRFRRDTGWQPVAGIEYGLRKTALSFLRENAR